MVSDQTNRAQTLVQTWDEFILEEVHGANSGKDQLEKCNSVTFVFPEDKMLVSHRWTLLLSDRSTRRLQVLFLPAERGRAVPAPSPDITFQSATHSSGRGNRAAGFLGAHLHSSRECWSWSDLGSVCLCSLQLLRAEGVAPAAETLCSLNTS